MAESTASATPPITPYLTVSDGAGAIAFYQAAFGAEEETRMPAADGRRLMHARLTLNGGVIMLSDDFPEFHGGRPYAPDALDGSPVTIHLEVADVDAAFSRAVDAGATATMPPADQFWGARYARLRDPFGHEWSLASPTRAA